MSFSLSFKFTVWILRKLKPATVASNRICYYRVNIYIRKPFYFGLTSFASMVASIKPKGTKFLKKEKRFVIRVAI